MFSRRGRFCFCTVLDRLGWPASHPRDQPLQDHGFSMHQPWQQGKNLHAGPFMDDTGGAAVVLCEDEQEARLVMERDPAVIGGIFVSEVHPWYMVVWERFGQNV